MSMYECATASKDRHLSIWFQWNDDDYTKNYYRRLPLYGVV